MRCYNLYYKVFIFVVRFNEQRLLTSASYGVNSVGPNIADRPCPPLILIGGRGGYPLDDFVPGNAEVQFDLTRGFFFLLLLSLFDIE